jgi:hypothetical protein
VNPSKPSLQNIDLSAETILRRRDGVVLRHVAGEHMLVPAVTREVDLECLFMLNATGVFVWERLDGEHKVADLGKAVAQEYRLDSAGSTADVKLFLSSLVERNLVVRMDVHGS